MRGPALGTSAGDQGRGTGLQGRADGGRRAGRHIRRVALKFQMVAGRRPKPRGPQRRTTCRCQPPPTLLTPREAAGPPLPSARLPSTDQLSFLFFPFYACPKSAASRLPCVQALRPAPRADLPQGGRGRGGGGREERGGRGAEWYCNYLEYLHPTSPPDSDPQPPPTPPHRPISSCPNA